MVEADPAVGQATNDALQNGLELERASMLATSTPGAALSDAEVAELFAHYIDTLAPWYDLNDAQRLFGTVVPENSIGCPVLFRAVIAFAASHKSRTTGTAQVLAPAFHAACVQDFLLLTSRIEPGFHGNELAATCLLRSYEIMNGKYILKHWNSDRHTKTFSRGHGKRTESPTGCIFFLRG